VLAKTWKNEGIRGIQRGLPPAVRSGHLFTHNVADQLFSTPTKYDLIIRTLRLPDTSLNCSDLTQRFKARLVALPELIRPLWNLPTGFYEPFRRGINKFIGRPAGEQIPFTSVLAGASSGAVGGTFSPLASNSSLIWSIASLGNPLFLIKARMQVRNLAIGNKQRP